MIHLVKQKEILSVGERLKVDNITVNRHGDMKK